MTDDEVMKYLIELSNESERIDKDIARNATRI